MSKFDNHGLKNSKYSIIWYKLLLSSEYKIKPIIIKSIIIYNL